MSQEWVTKVETGRIVSSKANTLRRVAGLLNLPIEELYLAANVASSPSGARRVADEAPAYEPDDPRVRLTDRLRAIDFRGHPNWEELIESTLALVEGWQRQGKEAKR